MGTFKVIPKEIKTEILAKVRLRTGPSDEKEILPFLSPEVEPGDVINLAPHHFFMKVTNEDSEDAFSGVTIPLDVPRDEKIAEFIIKNTKRVYGRPRETVEKKLEALFGTKKKTTATSANGTRKKDTTNKDGEDEGMDN